MNSISKQILRAPQFFPKLVVASLLIYSLVGIPIFVGYLARFLQQFWDRKEPALPQWNDWLALVIECWELLVVLLAYAVIPMALSVMIASWIDQWFGSVAWIPLWTIPWIPVMAICFASPILVSLAYIQYLKNGNFESILNFKNIYQDFLRSKEELFTLTFMLWGVLVIGFPLIGFTIAIGLVLYIPLVINIVDNNRYR